MVSISKFKATFLAKTSTSLSASLRVGVDVEAHEAKRFSSGSFLDQRDIVTRKESLDHHRNLRVGACE